MNEFELRRQLAGLRQPREPSRDLWPAIEQTIGATLRRSPATVRHVQPGWRGWAVAASMLLAALMWWPQARPPLDPAAVAQAHRSTAHAAVERQADALHAQYAAALAQLAGVPLPAELQRTNRELEQNEQAIRAALRRHPESTFLLGQLRRTYEHQLRISQLAAFG